MTFATLFFTILQLLVIALLIVWWLHWMSSGLEWVVFAFVVAAMLSYFSSKVFIVPPYRAGCEGICGGWRGFPILTHHIAAGDIVLFDAVSFARNTLFYYAYLLGFSGLIVWLGRLWRWPVRSWRQRFVFLLIIVLLPLATLPMWVPPPQPHLLLPEQRLAINAARDWRWQLHLSGFMDRRLALEDVRDLPDGESHRVCFRIYTWYYLPYRHVYIDLEPAGVRAIGGAEIPLSDSCWTQPSVLESKE